LLEDVRALENGRVLEAEVCVVGAGAAGITLARQWIGRGFRVCVLESGGTGPRATAQRLNRGESTGLPYFPLEQARLRQLGGTTGLWAGWCAPFDELDFEARDGVAHTGWPITRAQLDPYYRRAHEVCGLGPYDYRVERWQRPDSSPLCLPDERVVTRVFRIRPTHFGRAYRHELAAADNVHVLLGATAIELETDASGARVTHARVAARGGRRLRVAARHFVLAAGGIENARLLLVSRRGHSAGVGNAHDLVGRFFTEHPYLDSATWHPSGRGPSLGLYRPHAVGGAEGAATVSGALALRPSLLRREGLVGCVFLVRPPHKSHPAYASDAVQSAIELGHALRCRQWPERALRRTGQVLLGPHQILRAAWERRFASLRRPLARVGLRVFIEAAPNPESRVTLSDRRDAWGVPLPRLCWRLTGLDRRSLDRAHEVLAGELARAGLGRLDVHLEQEADAWPERMTGGRHHMGTTRMHADPRRGVVDADCRVHGVSNLYVAGSSAFPTAGSANPTLTIVALAIRLGEHLEALLRGRPAARAPRARDVAYDEGTEAPEQRALAEQKR
jgi:choline dehydrogenase-like flavoprotein